MPEPFKYVLDRTMLEEKYYARQCCSCGMPNDSVHLKPSAIERHDTYQDRILIARKRYVTKILQRIVKK